MLKRASSNQSQTLRAQKRMCCFPFAGMLPYFQMQGPRLAYLKPLLVSSLCMLFSNNILMLFENDTHILMVFATVMISFYLISLYYGI